MNELQDLMLPADAATFLCTTRATLAKYRSTGENKIPYRRLGKKILYSRADLTKYLAKHSFNRVDGGE
ncbi:MAG: helix-turn-helix domain-containing protein [Cycloclasticus sp.]|nr:helix-turn-helix domain-containing protein [Cycloclasticus sp.]